MSGDTSTLPPPPTPPPPPPRFELAPGPSASLRQVGLVGAAGVGAAVLLPFRSPGIAMVLTAYLIAGAVVVARRGEPDRERDAGWRWTCGALALALALLPAYTDAGWVLSLTIPASIGLAVLAAGGGRSWLGTIAPALRVAALSCTGIGAAGSTLRTAVPDATRAGRHLLTGALTIAVLVVFGALFTSADPVFARLIGALIPDVVLESLLGRLLITAAVAAASLALVLLRVDPADDEARPPSRTLTGTEWVVPLGALVALFSAFVLVQLGHWFGGDAVVQRTPGLTYAEHAREGFGQLLVAAVLTLGVIGTASRYAHPSSPPEERLRRSLFAGLCGLTLVVLASALHRLSLYEAAFGLTRDRATAFATILWLGGLFVLVLALGAARRSHHLPRAAVALTAVSLLTFALLRPDVMVARSNIERLEATGELEYQVLWTLSADAVPTIASSMDPDVAACVIAPTDATADRLSWNLARSRADRARGEVHGSCALDVEPAWHADEVER